MLGKEKKDAPDTAGENLAQQEEERRKVPSWLVSFVFHLSLLLILALVPIRQFAQGPFTLFMGDGSAGGLAEFELLGPQTDELQAAELMEVPVTEDVFEPNELLQVELPKLVVSKEETVVEVGETGENEPLINIPYGVENGLIGRTGKLKSQLLSKYGGNADTESAVELGLKWLARQQKSDGSWSLQGPYSEGGASENTTAATALAINAFLGAGYTHKSGKYQSNVKLGLAYLVRRQDSDGFFSDREPSRQQMYAQAIASIAVIEAFGMSGDSELRIAATQAIRFAEWSQSQLKGWRYEPRVDADLSVTGWFVMALVTGKMAGLNIDEELFKSVHQFLDSVSYEEDSRYGYSRFERQPSLSMTAEGMLCRLYLGWSRSNPALLRAIHDDLLPSKPRIDDQDEYSIYYWYYATQVLHHVGGVPWREWNEAMKKVIPTMQIKNGPEKGSWDPSDDVFGPSGGRLYITCLNIYCLEVYYRHLAIYDVK